MIIGVPVLNHINLCASPGPTRCLSMPVRKRHLTLDGTAEAHLQYFNMLLDQFIGCLLFTSHLQHQQVAFIFVAAVSPHASVLRIESHLVGVIYNLTVLRVIYLKPLAKSAGRKTVCRILQLVRHGDHIQPAAHLHASPGHTR